MSDPTIKDPLRYQSPIALNLDEDVFPIKQCINIRGKNKGATYVPDNHIFELEDKIILRINNKKYRLVEYHFHTPAEHVLNGKEYPSEIHYVFYEIKRGGSNHVKKFDVCNGENTDVDILVIGRVIKNTHERINLSKLSVHLPSSYFEYDGSLTGEGDGSVPVRWIVGADHIRIPLDEIIQVSKSSREIQPLDDRIILYEC